MIDDDVKRLQAEQTHIRYQQQSQETKAAAESIRVEAALVKIEKAVEKTIESVEILVKQMEESTQFDDQAEGYKRLAQVQSLTIQDLEDTIADKDAEIAALKEQLKKVSLPPAFVPNIYTAPPSNGINLPNIQAAKGGLQYPTAQAYRF